MAIATGTAMTIAAAAGLAATATTTTMSFVQAGKQKNAQRQAERDADQAMADARKKLETNYYGGLSIQKEPYELEREALLAQGAEAIQAGVESERGAAPIAGRVLLAQQQGQAGIRTAMGQELSALEKLSAQEQSRLAGAQANLSLEEVAGAQRAGANAQMLGAQATQQGMQGVVSLGQQAAQFVPLFAEKPSTATPTLTNMNIPSVSSIMPSLRASTATPATASTIGMQSAGVTQPQYQPWNFYTNQQSPFAPFYQNPSVGGK